MNTVDIGILVIMFLSALMGIMRGITREVLGLISWAAAGFSAFFTLPLTQTLSRTYIHNPMLADIVAVFILFVIFLILFSFISQFFTGLVRQSGLGGVDRSLGFGYGLLRGITLVCLVEIIMGIFVSRPEYPALIRDSHLSSTIYKGSDFIFQFLPSSVQQLIKNHQLKYGENTTSAIKTSSMVSKHENLLTDAIKSQIHHGAQAIIPSTLSAQSPPPSITNHSNGKPSSATSPSVDNQKTVEELARLRPKAAEQKNSATAYTKKQRLDMDRLLEQEDIPE